MPSLDTLAAWADDQTKCPSLSVRLRRKTRRNVREQGKAACRHVPDRCPRGPGPGRAAGFARSADGGAHFSKPITLPDSSGSDDPAVAVAPDGTVYVSYLRYHGNYAYPVVAASFDHGASFSQVASLIPHKAGNWGDRDFIAAGRGGTVYVTWDYGPSAADVKIVCAPSGSCAYSAVDATAVVQKSTD